MTEENNAEDPAERSGEVLRGGAPAPVPVQTGTIGWLFSRLSRWPFRNRRYLQSMKTAQEVLEARKQLGKTYIEHEEISGQVQDLPITIGKQRMQRIREYCAEERQLITEVNDSVVEGKMREEKNKLKQRDVELQQIEQEKKLLRARKELEELQNPPQPPPPSGPGRAQSEKMKRREDAHKRYESASKRIDKMKVSAKAKTDLKTAAQNELEKEIQQIDQEP